MYGSEKVNGRNPDRSPDVLDWSLYSPRYIWKKFHSNP